MNQFRYFMPTDTYFGRGCIKANQDVLRRYGTKAMLVTGKTSAKKNGAQKDVTEALDALGIAWVVFDEIGENPDVETVVRAAEVAKAEQVSFFIGIGGGSPMDASKAIAVLAANPNEDSNILFADASAKALPVVAVPTTAGTGSEVTQYAILTLHKQRTKSGIAMPVFAEAAFLDPQYMDTLSAKITNNTAVDAMSHLVESYLSSHANTVSEKIAEMGLLHWKAVIPALRTRRYTAEDRDNLMLASAFGGAAIAQTSTSIPHALGYFLTYEKAIPHGRANGMVMRGYLELFGSHHAKVERILYCLGLDNLESFGLLLEEILDTEETFVPEEIAYYAKRAMENPKKMATFPEFALQESDIVEIYRKSLKMK
ncbi:MAG TPA: iron-containing alcohol dehydrogenase [Candidatus Anaerotignum merdipullorum]|nr:iron-containing alcohol dehydrogenase [Candidatus Anaerotignum merdipullorum]